MSKLEFTKEQKLIHYYLLNTAQMPDMGILHGRMRSIIHLLELSKSEACDIYEDFAIELLDEVIDAVDSEFPVGFDYGICGIGWGLEYIIKKRLLAVDEDICMSLDKYVYAYLKREDYVGIGLQKGLLGVLLYFLSRLENQDLVPKTSTSICVLHIKEVLEIMQRLLTEEQIDLLCQERGDSDNDCFINIIFSKWDYPILVYSLAQVYEYGIEQHSVVRLMKKLLENRSVTNNFPKGSNNKVLLEEVVTRADNLIKVSNQ